jgi:uncharacterized protein (DUF433 family)
MSATITVPIERNADGVLHVGGTRVTLDTIVTAFQLGATAEEIALRYPTLEIADIYGVIGYYLRHRTEVEEYLQMRKQQANEVQSEVEKRFPPEGIRNRLLARRSAAKE